MISTVGNMTNSMHGHALTADEAIYETMVFRAVDQDGYLDADVSQEIYVNSTNRLYGKKGKGPAFLDDLRANDMHETVVQEVEKWIESGERLPKRMAKKEYEQ